MLHYDLTDSLLPSNGFYGRFGGAFVPDDVKLRLQQIESAFRASLSDASFISDFERLMHDYVGRPTPLYKSERLSEIYGASIYLKREDLNHTGAHKINNAIGLGLLAKRMGKSHIIAETGAGQHGVAAATVAALLGLKCTVYMGAVDMERQQPNVQRMRMLGADVVAVTSGSQNLNNAVDTAIAAWIADDDAFYMMGTATGPHPYPEMVSRFQSIISAEIKHQLLAEVGRENPDYVVAAIGGGSNASGAFYHFINSPEVHLVAVEAAGKGVNTPDNAATITNGREGMLHGTKTMVMQDNDGNTLEAYSISAGLDYPGIGPLLAHLADTGRICVTTATDSEALDAAFQLIRCDGIIPALESSHALAALEKITLHPDDIVVVNLSGRGDKDLNTMINATNLNNAN